jgi:hypothetical protein
MSNVSSPRSSISLAHANRATQRILSCAILVIQGLAGAPAYAEAASSPVAAKVQRVTFVPNPKDGAPVRHPRSCGAATATSDSLARDLGKGVSLWVFPSQRGPQTTVVHLVFNYHDTKSSLTLVPEEFELRTYPNGKVATPAKIARRILDIPEFEQFQQEVRLEFALSVENMEKVEFFFPPETIKTTQGDSRPLAVRPFAFGVVTSSGEFAGGDACMFSPVDWGTLLREFRPSPAPSVGVQRSETVSPPTISLSARLESCDSHVMQAAVAELIRYPRGVREPLMLFKAAGAQRAAGFKEEAAFLYLLAQLRTARQLLLERGDRPQLRMITAGAVGPLVMPVLEADPELARQVVRRVIEWDRSAPDPFRDDERARSGDMPEKFARLDASLARLPDEIEKDAARTAKAREGNLQAERQLALFNERCRPGRLDSVDLEAATAAINTQAETFARTNSLVVAQAGGGVRAVSVGSYRVGETRLPQRVTVSVAPLSGQGFFAEVDVNAEITSARKLGSIRTSLVCITKLSTGQRDGRWKDVCVGDPNVIRP